MCGPAWKPEEPPGVPCHCRRGGPSLSTKGTATAFLLGVDSRLPLPVPSRPIEGAFHLRLKSKEPNSDESDMRTTADSLIRIATKAFMQMQDVDYETAQRWIAEAAVEGKSKKAPKSRRVRKLR
jgi:hypothetical protein